MDTSAPIGVFDSGMGGLTVLQALRQALPQERLLYVADSSHAPYGDKSLEYIQQRALTLTHFLLEQGVKALVIASNTTTAASVDFLRSTFPVPIVAVEPALKLAVASTRTGVVGALVTVATSQSTRFTTLLERFRQDVKVIIQPAPGLVEQIEMGELTGSATRALIERYVTPLLAAGADTIVLGSTHYPHLRPLIAEVAGPEVVLIDTGEAVARQLHRVLEARELLNEDPTPGDVQFWTSGDTQLAQQVISLLWGTPVGVQQLPEAFI
ncbi:glutamate racemase [Dictyobacter aurantiacus]|uniref:Glutamate racemase n=1 Tax=Dictyobacter aurantiacus TaxID=1936993 RepID=A0A401ZSV0_9CHLR|nr:glutamate racemase [Dictyobacter aurantiacus]GCE09943.1 glutamate racemase [Dictyobacter aurantiacus]